MLTDAEVNFMGLLWRIVRTPRATKRLVNTYRLLRASLSPVALARLVGSDSGSGEFPVVLMLLAVMIGYPALSNRFFAELLSQPGERGWWDWVVDSQKVSKNGGRTPETGSGVEARAASKQHDSEQWSQIWMELLRIRPDARVEGSISPFKDWAPRVGRFSFESVVPIGQQDASPSGHLASDLALSPASVNDSSGSASSQGAVSGVVGPDSSAAERAT